MKKFIFMVLVLVLAVPCFASISVKGGLAGGAFRLGATADRTLKDNLNLVGEVGYGFGSGYSLGSVSVGLQSNIRENIYLGADACYSSYSSAVKLGLPAVDITELGGFGIGVYAGLKRDKMYGQVGYDTRLGALAEAGYIVRM